MTKEEALQDFLRSFRLALKSASLYPKEHPAFKKSIEDLKEKKDIVLKFAPGLKIAFTPRSVVTDDKTWEKDKLWEELAHFFHIRRIMSLEARQDATIDDWQAFIGFLSFTPQEIAKAGGIRLLLERERIFSFVVEELDYSELLAGEGYEIKDIWTYLLSESVRERDPQKIRQVAASFPRIIGEINLARILDDREQLEDFGRFFACLKTEAEEEFQKCALETARKILRERLITEEDKFRELKDIAAGARDQDLASLLLKEMASGSRFDAMSLDIFFRLLGREKCRRVAGCLEEEARRNPTLLEQSPHLKERVEEFLSGGLPPSLFPCYREALSGLLREISVHKKPALDRELLRRSYRFMLLNVLAAEPRKEAALDLLAAILEEWKSIIQDKDLEFLKSLFELLEKKADALSAEPLFGKIRAVLTDFIEKSILKGEARPELDYFIQRLPRSTLGVNYYLETIFGESKVTPTALRMFFHLFPDSIFYFNLNLEKKKSDRSFLEKMIESLAEVDSLLSLATLKNIFGLGDHLAKLKSLRAMGNLSTCDERFLLPILRKGDFSQKKEALKILKKEEGSRKKALKMFFLTRSPFGLRNRVLLEHLRIAADLELREAAEHIVRLSQRKFFWNKSLRREAAGLLEKWSFGQA
jgi:predicted house-cleaning noncanonical NTP pyrophosphatase (MazG superfamily)